jgi:hypothetical protein
MLWRIRQAQNPLRAVLPVEGGALENGINGTLMPFPRHRWSIDVVTAGASE